MSSSPELVDDMKKNSKSNGNKDRIFSLISIAIGCAIALYLAEWLAGSYIRYIQQSDQMDTGLLRYHDVRGWQLSPAWQGEHRHYDYQANYSINSLGYRGELSPVKKQARCERVAIVGDSFTFGFGVNDNETFSARLEQQRSLTDTSHCSNPKYLNYGVPGTSTDQQALLIQDTIYAMQPDKIVWVVYLANDLFDNLLNYPLQAEQAKSFYQLGEDDKLQLKNVPVPKQAKPAALRGLSLSSVVLAGVDTKKAWWVSMLERWSLYAVLGMENLSAPEQGWQPVFEKNFSEALALYQAILLNNVNEAKAKKIDVNLVVLAGRSWHVSPDSVSGRYQEYLRQQVIEIANNNSISVIDVASGLKANSDVNQAELFFPYDGHLTPLGHLEVAKIIAGDNN
jgi:hypothetical protein